MNIGIVHISDIHLKSDDQNMIKEKAESLHNAISSGLLDLEKVFLVITGDIAFSGKEDEFEIGYDLISDIVTNINRQTGQQIEVIIIPGNHDCDFSGNLTLRNLVLKDFDSSITDEDIIKEICKPLENYFSFEEVLLETGNIVFSDNLFKQFEFVFGDYNIQFNCLNTSWVSKRNEVPGAMTYPIGNYREKMEKSADLSITLLHHPTHWLEPNQKRFIDETLKSNSDIIISGHEHTATNSFNNDFNDNQTIYFEASALQTGDPEESSFSIIKINLKKSLLTKEDYIWNSNLYYREEVITNKTIHIRKTKKKNEFQIRDEFSDWLNDIGIPIKHPRMKETVLTDLYVYPNAKFVKYADQRTIENEVNINLSEIIDIEKNEKILIAGQENYGKTSLCKVIFQSKLNKGYIPIYIKGEQLHKSSPRDISKIIKKQFLLQYDEDTTDKFEQQDTKKILVIIDDLDNSPLNRKYRNTLMTNLGIYYPNIVVTASELTKFSDLISDVEFRNPFDGFIKLEMLPFGHRLRGELIEKWNKFGELQSQNESTLIKNIDRSENIVSSIIGNNFIPSVPFFILVILQTEESEQSNLTESAYGYYYEYLINQSLMNIKLKNEDIDAFNNYLAHLAYKFYDDGDAEKTQRELLEFHQRYCTEYDLNVEFSEYEKKILEASILRKSNQSYSFKYKYIYYYFVAKYLSQYIMNKDIEEKIIDMCNRLYIEEFSNIIMFLSHLSKNPIILNSVLNSAKLILNEISPAKLEDDIQPLNELIVSIPRMVIDHKDTLKNRQERQIAIDEIEKGRNETASGTIEVDTPNDDKSYEEFDIISKINWATKTLEIMGQILKNYYGSTPAKQKLLLGQEVYLLSMRALNAFLETFSQNRDFLLQEIEKVLKERDIVDSAKTESISRQFVFNLMSAISQYFIKKVSSSVGTINLEETLVKILEQNNMISVKLIDLAIKLDHGHSIPFKEIENFKNELPRNNFLSLNILRILVVEHMYMFHVDYSDKQRIIEMLDINEKTEKRITLANVQKLN